MFTGVCSVKFTYHILYRPIRLLFGSSYSRKTEAYTVERQSKWRLYKRPTICAKISTIELL